jgi:phosphoribosylformimino-5-aminoimidazole carboxamide ribotide isomerase
MFEVIPAIDLMGGKCVQLKGGRREKVLFSADNPAEIAKNWLKKGARALHIIDLDGAFQLGPTPTNWEAIKDIAAVAKGKARTQVGGGIRSYEIAKKFMEIGIDRVILGTAAVKNPALVETLAREFSPERVMVALDAKKGKVAVEGWTEGTSISTEQFAKKFEGVAGAFLFTNVDVEGLMKGVDVKPIRNLVRSVKTPVIIAGGVTTLEDVKIIEECGAAGVVVGVALYKGKIKLEEVLKFQTLPDGQPML